jgi:pimeloyl-[acyl-carrier protein] methyl ester esterase
MIRPTLLFVHGWGFGSDFWEPLRKLLAEWPHAVADLGYFGSAQWPKPIGPIVGIGHSYGLAHLLQTEMPPYDALIGINGFTRFTACADFPYGTPARVVERMMTRLASDPIDVVNNFRARCHAAATDRTPNVERLACDLRNMYNGDPRAMFAKSTYPFLALAAEDDPIVLADTTRASFPSERIQWSPQGGHLLPLSEPSWCAQHIRAFLANLAMQRNTHE